MANPDISTIYDLDNDSLRKAEHYRVGDKIYVRVGNQDGEPMLVAITDDPNDQDLIEYDNASAVGINDLTTIVSYIVPTGKVLFLNSIDFSGSNYGCYTVRIGGAISKVKRTHYGASLNDKFSYNNYRVSAGVEVKIEITHNQDLGQSGDFDATIEGKLRDA